MKNLLTSDKAELINGFWDEAKEVLVEAMMREMASYPETDPVKLAWSAGFYHCLRALESGRLQSVGTLSVGKN